MAIQRTMFFNIMAWGDLTKLRCSIVLSISIKEADYGV